MAGARQLAGDGVEADAPAAAVAVDVVIHGGHDRRLAGHFQGDLGGIGPGVRCARHRRQLAREPLRQLAHGAVLVLAHHAWNVWRAGSGSVRPSAHRRPGGVRRARGRPYRASRADAR